MVVVENITFMIDDEGALTIIDTNRRNENIVTIEKEHMEEFTHAMNAISALLQKKPLVD